MTGWLCCTELWWHGQSFQESTVEEDCLFTSWQLANKVETEGARIPEYSSGVLSNLPTFFLLLLSPNGFLISQ